MTGHSDGIPWSGVQRVVRDWSGRSELVDALDSLADPTLGDRTWTRADVERRAHWVSMLANEARLTTLPQTTAGWREALPAETERRRSTDPAPGAHTNWVSTRVRHGWPPRRFENVHRRKSQVQAVRRVGYRAAQLVAAWAKATEELGDTISARAERAAVSLTSMSGEWAGDRASRDDLAVARALGSPWSTLVHLIESVDRNLLELAQSLVRPDQSLAAAMFHVGVLGNILVAADERRVSCVSLRPVTHATTPGPCYRLRERDLAVDVWSEAAGHWGTMGGTSQLYTELRGAAGLSTAALAPDILLIGNGDVVAIECKYSLDETYAIRSGYHQATTYALELARLHDSVTSVVAVRDELLDAPSFVSLDGVHRLGVVPVSKVGQLLDGPLASVAVGV